MDDTGNGQAAGHFDFAVHADVTTIVLFPEEIVEGDGIPDPYFKVAIADRKAAISSTRRSLARGIQRNVVLSTDHIDVGLMLTPTERQSDAVVLAVVRRRSEVERWQARYEDYAATRDAQRERDAQRRSDRAALELVLDMHATPVQPKTVLGDVAPRAKGIAEVTISHVEGLWSGPDMQTTQNIQNIQMMELRPVEPPDPERDKVSLHLQGVYGAVWLGDGAGLEKSDATRLTGLGVRAQYAFNRWLAFEGEIMGAGTGSAHCDNVTFEGEQGELTRSARLGRAQFGRVLRFGQGTYVPLARLGVGLQGASHRGTLTTATGEAPGPDAGFSFDALWHFGTGLDLRLGERFIAGIGLSAVVVAKNLAAEGVSGSIEAGIHLGYGWKP